MCGIAGIVRLKDEPIRAEYINSLLIGLQIRGGDATGIATLTGNKLGYIKDDEIAWKFCADNKTEAFLDSNLKPETDIVLLHTRASSKGSAWKNENNHPLTVGKSAVIHNGTLQNDDELFKEWKYERKAETDSDLLRAVFDAEGITRDALRKLQRIRGSCAIAAVSTDYPGQFVLGRSGSPLVLAYTADYFIWASIKAPIYAAMRNWVEWHGMYFQRSKADLHFSPMEQEEIMLFNINELRNNPKYKPWKQPFEVCKNYVPPCYRVHEQYPEKQRKKREQKAEEERKRREEAERRQKEVVNKPPADQQNVPGTAVVEERPKQAQRVSLASKPGHLIVLKNEPSMTAHKGFKFKCRNDACPQLMEITEEQDGQKLWQLECPKCHTLLADLEVSN